MSIIRGKIAGEELPSYTLSIPQLNKCVERKKERK